MISTSELPQRVKWSSHIAFMRNHWHPGQHISVITPTGGGKSYLAVKGLLKLPAIQHARVLFFDDKHTDESTREFGLPVADWPKDFYPRVHNRMHAAVTGKRMCPTPEHYRLIIPEWDWAQTQEQAAAHAQRIVLRSFERCYKTATPGDGWVLVLDETRTLSDTRPPSLNLAPALKYLWRMGRYRHVTIIALTQMPMGVPGEMFDQPTHLYFGRDQDERRIDRFAEMGGSLPRRLMRAAIPTLDDNEFLFLGNRGKVASIVQVGRE